MLKTLSFWHGNIAVIYLQSTQQEVIRLDVAVDDVAAVHLFDDV